MKAIIPMLTPEECVLRRGVEVFSTLYSYSSVDPVPPVAKRFRFF